MYDLIGADIVPAVVAQPVWLRAVVTREGPEVVTRCCVVAGGQFHPIEVRVNVPELAATLRAMGLGPSGDSVSGFGSFLKKAVKSVTHSKVVKAVGKVVRKVASNPVVQVLNPAMAITTHTISKAATGKGTIKGAAGKAVDMGTAVAKMVAGPIGGGALNFVGPKAQAALGIGLKAVTAAKAGAAVQAAAKLAQGQVALGKTAAQAIAQKTVDPKKALPLVKRAVAIRTNIQKQAPALAKKVAQSTAVKAQLQTIAAKARAGSAEAAIAAKTIAAAAKAIDTVQKLQANAAGGLPGLLVTSDGRIVKAPRGTFKLRTTVTARPDILYRGAREPGLKGLFSVAGESWGGDRDPGNDIEGPRYDVTPEGGKWLLEDLSVSGTGSVHHVAVAGALTP